MTEKSEEAPRLPKEEELMAIFVAAKGTVCKDCKLVGNGCTYHEQDRQSFICPVDAYKLTNEVMALLGRKPEGTAVPAQ